MSWSNEIFKPFFNENEYNKVEKEIDKNSDFKELMEKAREKQINVQLDALQLKIDKVKDNFKKRLDFFKNAIKKVDIVENEEDITTEKIQTQLSKEWKLKKELRKKASNKIPIIWWFLFDFVSKIDTKNNNSWLWNILKYIKSSILSWLWIENFEEQLEKVKLNKEQIKETKEKITEYLVQNLKLNWKEEDIKKILNNPDIFTSEKLVEYYKKIQSWDWFSSNDLMEDFWNIWNIKETIKESLKKLDKKAFDKISEFYYRNYWEILDEWDSEDLKSIIKKYITNWNLSDKKLNEILDKKEFKIADLYPLLWDWMMFMLELVWKWIIDITDIAFDFASKGGDMINLSIWRFWISDSISTDSLIEKINWLEEDEKALLIWILYRKGWLFLSILWNIAATATRAWLDIALGANSWVDWLKIFKDWLFKWPAQQLKNMSKIEQAITWVADNIYITKVKDSFKMLEKNYKIMSIIWNSKDIEWFKKQLNWKNWFFIKEYLWKDFDIKKYNDIDEISKLASKKVGSGFVDDFEIKFEKWKNHFIKEKIFGFWKSSAMQELNRAIWDVVKNQQNILDKGFWYFSKFRETLSASKISHLSDKLVFEFENKKWAKTFLKQMNVLAQSSPELIKWIFNKLPIISVVGLAASWDESFKENLAKEVPYLIPIIWPILIIWEWGFSWNNWNPKIDNPENILLGWWLLTLDWWLWYKAASSWKFIRFMWKPVLDLFDIWKWTAEFIQKTYKTGRAFDSSKNFLKKMKWAKIKPKSIYVLWAILAWYITYEMLKKEWYEEVMWEYYKDWKYDFEKAREDYNNMDLKEKEEFIRLLFTDSANEIININIKDNIEILSKDKTKLNWSWFIDDKRRLIFEQIIWKKIIFKYS